MVIFYTPNVNKRSHIILFFHKNFLVLNLLKIMLISTKNLEHLIRFKILIKYYYRCNFLCIFIFVEYNLITLGTKNKYLNKKIYIYN